AASLRTGSGDVVGAIRRHTGRCHWVGDLFQRGAVHSARHAVVRRFFLTIAVLLALPSSARATTKGLSQIVTPELQGAGDLSLSFQAQSERIANPYELDRKSTRLNSSHVAISYAVFCLKKKKKKKIII